MHTVRNILYYLNPFDRLGKKQYSIAFPLFATLLTAISLEFYYHAVVNYPELVRTPAVLVFIGLIIYFSLRDGIRGGMTATIITILYYLYIITSQYTNQATLTKDFETTIAFSALYLFLAAVIGGLKQKTDNLIEKEADEKQRLETILQQIPVGVIVTDKNGKVTHANKQLEIISGYKIFVGATLGKDKMLIPETYNVEPTQSPLNQVLKAGKTLMKQEYSIKRKDGKKRYIQISAAPILGKKNEIISAAAIITDITLQKEQEQRKDDFVNIASHELKTPITSMQLYIDSLASKLKILKDAKSIKILNNISYQTDRLQELVSDLLDVSRLQTGKMKFVKEKLRLDLLLTDTLENLQGTTKQQKILFIEKPQVTVYADKFRIDQVITNLITNAIKYSPPKTDIVIKLQKEKTKAVVSIQDFGIGISKEQQKKIFDRLYQVSEPKEKTFPGLGIGLYITKQIVKRHKGSIWVKSEKEKGSTFSFTLPLTS